MKKEKLKKILTSRAAKSLALLLVVALIGVAIYVNYRVFYNNGTENLGYGSNNMQNTQDGTASVGGSAQEEDYFSSTLLNRQQSRDEAIDVLKMVTENEQSSAEAKAEAEEKLSKIALDIQNEANIETLVKAKGFEECVAIISEDAVSVIVSAESLQAAEAAQILSIVYDTTGINPENVSIVNK